MNYADREVDTSVSEYEKTALEAMEAPKPEDIYQGDPSTRALSWEEYAEELTRRDQEKGCCCNCDC